MYTIAGIQEYVHPPRAGEDRFLRYHLDVETNFGREEGIVGTYTAAQLEKKERAPCEGYK